MDKVNYVEMKHVSELAIIGLLLKPFKTWVVPGKPTVILTRTRGGMLEIELVSNISNTSDSGSSGYPNTEKRVENTTRSGVFLTKFEVFG